jgi:hypothetical protein
MEQIVQNAISLSYFSRGAFPYDTVMSMTHVEKKIALDFIKDHIKTEMKTRPKSPNY